MRGRPLLVVPVVVLGLVMAGCGGDGDEQPEVTGSPTAVVTVTESATATATATTTATRTAPPTTATATQQSARSVVLAYYAAINARDYRTAWELGGRNLVGSYEKFVSGFDGLLADHVVVRSSDASSVTISLHAVQTDGSTKLYEGTYQVRGGVITSAQVRELP